MREADETQQNVKNFPWDPMWEYILGEEEANEEESVSLTSAPPTQESWAKRKFWKKRCDDGSLTIESDIDKDSFNTGCWDVRSDDDEDHGTVDEASWTLSLDPFLRTTSSTLTGPNQKKGAQQQSAAVVESRDDAFHNSFQDSIRSAFSWEKPQPNQTSTAVANMTDERAIKSQSSATSGNASTSSSRNEKKTRKRGFWRRQRRDLSGGNVSLPYPNGKVKPFFTKSLSSKKKAFLKKKASSGGKSQNPIVKSRMTDPNLESSGSLANQRSRNSDRSLTKQGASTIDSFSPTNMFEWASNDGLQNAGAVFGALSWSSTPSAASGRSSSTSKQNSFSDKSGSFTDQEESQFVSESEDANAELNQRSFPQLNNLINWIENSDTDTDTDGGTLEGSCVTEDSQVTASQASTELGFKRSQDSSFVSVQGSQADSLPWKQRTLSDGATQHKEMTLQAQESRSATLASVATGEKPRAEPSRSVRSLSLHNNQPPTPNRGDYAAPRPIISNYTRGISPIQAHEFPKQNHRHKKENGHLTTFTAVSSMRDKPPTRRKKRSIVERALCFSAKSKTPQQQWNSAQTGTPYDELSPQELAQVFPKVRSVCDDASVSSSSVMLDSFDRSVPAHLQADLGMSGPHSVFEYEYEKGVHMQISYNEFDQIELTSMKLQNLSTPIPKRAQSKKDSNEVIVQVEASLVSRTDCTIRQGDWSPQGLLPIIPGVDAVGKLFSVDNAAQQRYNLNVGDRVLLLCSTRDQPPCGGNTRYLAAKPEQLVKVPERVDPALAACLPETYLTAFQILHMGQASQKRYEPLSLKGRTVLLLGKIISNEGRALSELARLAGADVLALCPRAHFSNVCKLGIHPLDINSIEWWDDISRKIDCITCIDEDVATIHYKLLKPSGRVVQLKIAGCEGATPSLSDTSEDRRSRRIQKRQESKTFVYDVYEEWESNLECCKLDLMHLVNLLVQGKITPRLLDRVPLNKVENAHELLMYKRLNGFIVCEPWLVAKSRAILL